MSAARSNARRGALRWVFVLAWMAVIFRLSALSGSSIPGNFGSYGHFGVYAVLGALVVFALRSPTFWPWAAALASAYGVTDEIHQLFVPGRMADPVDWVVDTIGAIVGALLVAWWLRRHSTET